MSPTGFETLYTTNCKNVPDPLWGPLRFFPWVGVGEGVGRDMKFVTHFHVVPRKRMSGAIPSHLYTPLWH